MAERDDLSSLTDHLAEGPFSRSHQFQDWLVTPVRGGANGLVYRAANATENLAVKFTPRDARGRAEREYTALSALRQHGLRLAPAPVRLETDRHPHPVVVQRWLEGKVMSAPPQTEAAWERLLQLYAAVHTLTPKTTGLPIKDAVFGAASPAKAKQLVFGQADLIPQRARPAELERLLGSLAGVFAPDSRAEPVLCHVDGNVSNFVYSDRLYAVDWEGSGWSDPAFEVANLMTHPAYMNVPRSRWQWVVGTYARLSRNAAVAERIWTYYPLLAAFWVARFARMLDEVPRGLDQRLVHRPEGWREDAARKYRHYLALAETLL